MSHGCDSDIVPFVAHDIAYCSHRTAPPDNDLWKVLVPEVWVDRYGTPEENANAFCPTVRGWTVAETHTTFGKKGRIYITWITKGEFKVAEVNESQYSNVGEHTESICSDNRESIEAFLSDFADCVKSSTIEETDIVEQWG